MTTIDDFKKLDIRIGKVVSVERVPEGNKLLKFIFDIGGEERQIMAAMAEFFPDPSVLVGKEMPLLINIAPANFKGYDSNGMILAADVNGKPVLLHPTEEIPAGSIVR